MIIDMGPTAASRRKKKYPRGKGMRGKHVIGNPTFSPPSFFSSRSYTMAMQTPSPYPCILDQTIRTEMVFQFCHESLFLHANVFQFYLCLCPKPNASLGVRPAFLIKDWLEPHLARRTCICMTFLCLVFSRFYSCNPSRTHLIEYHKACKRLY